MRPYCLFCCSKHISQAIVLMAEAKQGYPIHRWIAVGHLAEAGDEIVEKYPQLANDIRLTRLKLMGQSSEPLSSGELLYLLEEVRRYAVKEGQPTDEEWLANSVQSVAYVTQIM